jgi:glycosyltransferase involved in cell wall biosynthesis
MTYYLLGVALIWFGFTLAALRSAWASRGLPTLEELSSTERGLPYAGGDDRPGVSVVIAARDEQARIEQTVRGLLDQQGVDLELIVVDDRSTDGTRQILQRLAAEDPRLRLVPIDELPAGWLGKCHACWQGALAAQSSRHTPSAVRSTSDDPGYRADGTRSLPATLAREWLLFTDADIHMQPDLVARAIGTARRDGADHLTLLPGINCTGPLTRAAVLAFGQFLLVYASPAQINADRGRRGLGVGAFNLVRAEAYWAIGGHVPLRMEVVDDVKLGLLLRRAGFRQRVYSGLNLLEAEWAHSIGQTIRALEKNWFAGLNYRYSSALSVIAMVALLWFSAVLGPVLEPRWGWAALAGLFSTSITGLAQTRRAGWPWPVALLVPLGMLFFAVAGAHSVWKALRQGGIRWRDTFYSLAELRAGLVR